MASTLIREVAFLNVCGVQLAKQAKVNKESFRWPSWTFSGCRKRPGQWFLETPVTDRPRKADTCQRKFRCCSIRATDSAQMQATCKATAEDAAYMRRAVDLAVRARGHTSPNPMVGCVIVKDGKVIGEGFHPKAGEPHAEVFALRAAGEAAQGATAYVSLEPCNHFGRTPPCSQALVRAKVKRVVVGMVDPNPQVAGNGVKTLQSVGIEVVVGVEEELCQRVNEAFVHRMLYNVPFGILRSSMTLDGKPVTANEEAPAGSAFSKLLAAVDVVVVPEEALSDEGPSLLSNEPGAKMPLRVVMSRKLVLNLESPLFDTKAGPTVVITTADALKDSPSLEARLAEAGVELIVNSLSCSEAQEVFFKKGACLVLWEGGGGWLAEEAIRCKAVQKVLTSVVPSLEGGLSPLPVERTQISMDGTDIIIESSLGNS